MNKNVCGLLLVSLIIFLTAGCEKDKPTGLFDPNATGSLAPVITAMNPPDSALAGIVTITITGERFSPILRNNFVYFGKTKAEIISASETQLVVKSPNIVQDSIQVRVAVLGSMVFSNTMYYNLIRGVFEYGGFGEFDDPYFLDCDKDENLYVALLPLGATKTIVKITPAEEKTTSGTTTLPVVSSMKMGWDGLLYFARSTRDIFYIPAGGNATVKWKSAPGRVTDFDFNQNGIMYAGGRDAAIYSVDKDGNGATVATYTNMSIIAVRVFDGYLYVCTKDNTSSQQNIWRNLINTDNTLGTNEPYFNWSEKVSTTYEIRSLTFAKDGDMYVGTNAPETIFVVHPNGSHEPLYPGVLEPEGYALSWGNGIYLYVCRRHADTKKHRIIKINMLKEGAPYYGRLK